MNRPPLTGDAFGAFFEAVHDKEPFPWQLRLAREVCAAGRWPAELDLPTGTGKTAVLDIAAFAMAVDGDRPTAARTMPRRAFLVVDRRTVVDQAHERARKLAAKLREPKPDTILAQVAESLTRLRGQPKLTRLPTGRPLAVAYLRGAVPRDDGWAHDPSQPLLGISTVDQVGSRLLFRGYGVTPGMRSIHAGLLGNDIVYFLDEVHLSRPFAVTLAAVAKLRCWATSPVPGGLQVVTMSATHRPTMALPSSTEPPPPPPFELSPDDRSHLVLQPRLLAKKPVTTEMVKVAGDEPRRRAGFAQRLAELALGAASDQHRRIAVVVNRVDGALAVFEQINQKRPADAEVTLITGRMRAIDRADVEKGPLGAVKADVERDGKLRFVIATQCIEAGADLDFDVLVTECASLDALVQRFGRLDRLGGFGDARGFIAVRSDQCGDKAEPDPIYGAALAETWAWLEDRGVMAPLDFGIGGGIRDGAPDSVYPPAAPAPLLTPGYLDLWSQTRPTPALNPSVAPWLHGPDPGRPEVSVVWRADLLIDGTRLGDEALSDLLEACPPLRTEALTVPLWAVKAWLRGDRVASIADVEVDRRSADDERRRDEGQGRWVVRWLGADGEATVLDDPDQIQPGDTLVVPSSYGGLRYMNCAVDSGEPVQDRGDEARLRQRHRLVIRLASLAGSPLNDGDGDGVEPGNALRAWQAKLQSLARDVNEANQSDDDDASAGLGRLREHLAIAPKPHDWLAAVLATTTKELRLAVQIVEGRPGATNLIVEIPGKVRPPADRKPDDELPDIASDDDGASLTGSRVTLVDHLDHVADYALAFAATYNVPPALAKAVVVAAAWHDAGKADPRFQRWLVDGDEVAFAGLSECLAKSGRRRGDRHRQRQAYQRARYPKGARHELLSVAMLERSVDVIAPELDRDLVLHLIASHHGWCRPYAPVEDPGDTMAVAWQHQGKRLEASTDHGLSQAGASVVDRFWSLTGRYGWWGLAWLETLVRLADHSASRAEQQKDQYRVPEGQP